MDSIQLQLKNLRKKRDEQADPYAHIPPKLRTQFPPKTKEDDKPLQNSLNQQRARKNQAFVSQYDAMHRKINKHLQEDMLMFRENRPNKVIDFEKHPYQLPVEFDPEIEYSGYVAPPLKPLPPPKRRMVVSDWVVKSMRFQEKRPSKSVVVKEEDQPKKKVTAKEKKIKSFAEIFAPSNFQKLLKEHPVETDKQKEVVARFQKNIRMVLDDMKRVKFSISDMVGRKIIVPNSYPRPGSQQFFEHVKQNNIQKVEEMLQQCQFYVYDKDRSLMRPLHWAAKLGYLEIAKLLVNKRSLLNDQDQVGRSPLSLAIRSRHKAMVLYLVLEGAKMQKFYSSKDCGDDYHMIFLVDKVSEMSKTVQSRKISKQDFKRMMVDTFAVQL